MSNGLWPQGRRFAEVTGALAPKLTSIPYPVMWTLGLFTPLVEELRTIRYQFTGRS